MYRSNGAQKCFEKSAFPDLESCRYPEDYGAEFVAMLRAVEAVGSSETAQRLPSEMAGCVPVCD
jgi:hypothetical protein